MAIRTALVTPSVLAIALSSCAPATPGADETPEAAPATTPTETAPTETAPTETAPAETAMASDDAADAAGPGTIEIEEWTVPWEGRPRDPYTLDGDTIWFVGQRNSYIATLDVASGEMERIDLREGAGPHNLIVNADGDVWYAGNRDAHLGFYDVDAGTFSYVDTPRETAADPHTLIFDGNGDIWFSSQRANSIGRYLIDSEQLDIIPVPTAAARPYGIKIAPDGMIWVVLFGTHKIASVDPQTLELTEYDIPHEDARPRRIGITSDGRIWYGDYSRGYLGMYDPASGEFSEWPMPSGENARPYAMATDDQDRIWFVETGVDPNYFVGFDPATEEFFSITAVPSTGGVVRHMHYLQSRQEIWFGSDMLTIGRARIE